MSFIITPTDPHQGGGNSANPDPSQNGSRGPLRHLLVGTPHRVRATIRLLQARHYADHDRWTDLMNIHQDGLIIRPTLQEVYAYLDIPPWRD